MTRLAVLLLSLFVFSNAWAELEFTGFLENRVELIATNDSSPLNPDNAVLSLADISDQLRLRLSIDSSTYSAMGAHARISYSDTPTDSRFRHEALLDEAFLNISLPDRVNCILGKKRLAWGPAFLRNPTDVLSPPKNPRDPEPEENRQGTLIMKFERPLGNVTIAGVIAPEVMREDPRSFREDAIRMSARLKRTQLIGKVDWLVLDADLTGLVQYGQPVGAALEEKKWRVGLSFSRVLLGATEIHGEFLWQQGFRRASLVSGSTPSSQTSLDRMRDDSTVAGMVVGLHHSFSTNARLIIEYLHNDEGYSSAEIDALVDLLRAIWIASPQADSQEQADAYRRSLVDINQQISALTGDLRRNYAYLRLMRPRLREVLTLEGNVLWNLDDRSVLLFTEAEYETATNVFVFARTDIPINIAGKDTAEFGGLGIRSLGLRFGARVYF